MEPFAWVSLVFVVVLGGGFFAIIWWSLRRGRRVVSPPFVPTELPSVAVAESKPERSLDQSLVEQSGASCVLNGPLRASAARFQPFQVVELMSSYQAIFVLQQRGYREATRAELLQYLEWSAKSCPVGRIFALRLLSATLAEIERAPEEAHGGRFSYRLSQVLPDSQRADASSFVTLCPGDYVLGVQDVEETR